MIDELSRLLSHGSNALSDAPSDSAVEGSLKPHGSIGAELTHLLRRRNGFYCFNSALLVRPFSREDDPLGIVQWNARALWREEFGVDTGNALFFAEDLFGNQFCIRENAVTTFDPETGEFNPMCSTLNEWVAKLQSDERVLTASPLAKDWIALGNELRPGYRLLPKRPFVVGGSYTLDNLYALNDVVGMRFRATIANQIRDVPDGASIQFKFAPMNPSGAEH